MVEGRVTGPHGKPLTKVPVEVWWKRDGEWEPIYSTRTHRNGRYRITDVSNTRVIVSFGPRTPWGHGSQRWAPEWWRDATARADATVTRLRPGSTLVRDARLVPAATLSGTVTAPDGGPAPGVTVEVSAADDPEVVREAVTRADGSYVASGLPAGRYVLRYDVARTTDLAAGPTWYGGNPDRVGARVVTVRAARTVAGLDQQLPAAAGITVDWRDSTGEVVQDRPVLIFRATPGSGWTEYGVAFPRYEPGRTIGSLPAGRYRLYFFSFFREAGFFWPSSADLPGADDIVLAAGQTTTVVAHSEVGGSIGGVVRRPGGPANAAQVLAYHHDADGRWVRVPFYNPDSNAGVDGSVHTESDGGYRITGLLPGEYRIQFVGRRLFAGEWWQAADRAHARTIVVGEREDVRGIGGRLRPTSG